MSRRNRAAACKLTPCGTPLRATSGRSQAAARLQRSVLPSKPPLGDAASELAMSVALRGVRRRSRRVPPEAPSHQRARPGTAPGDRVLLPWIPLE